MDKVYPVIFRKTDNGYYAEAPDLEECFIEAKTFDGVFDGIREKIAEWIIEKEAENISIPAPSDYCEFQRDHYEHLVFPIELNHPPPTLSLRGGGFLIVTNKSFLYHRDVAQ